MYEIAYLPLAQEDLVGIVRYVTDRLEAPSAARRLADELVKAAQSLSEMPYRRRTYVPIRPLGHEYRVLTVGNYAIFYWIEESPKPEVVVARVLYAHSDLMRGLRDAERKA